MLIWLQKNAAQFLWRTGASVSINLKIDGELALKTNRGLMYGCDIVGQAFFPDGKLFYVPSGKFETKTAGEKG